MSGLRFQRKVNCPVLPAVHLYREALIKQLNEAVNCSTSAGDRQALPFKLVFLHAPAGYGKTTLLTDFAQQSALPCCWYFLDRTDVDRLTFLTTLLMSIRQRFPGFGSELDTLLTGASSEYANHPEGLHYFEVAVNALVAALDRDIPEPFIIMLCNYQEINELREINGLVGYLLQQLPAHCTLFIESRVIPNLDFAPLLAGQKIFGVGINQLRFTPGEIHKLAQLQGLEPLTDSEAGMLASSFDGWIAGILLGTRLNNVQQFHLTLPDSSGTNKPEGLVTSRYLFSYVVNEVFKSHQEVYAFLKDVSVLQEMSPDMCAALLNIPTSEVNAHFQYLEEKGLFVTHSGEGSEIIYTCTPVLRKLFQEELSKEAPERFSALHQRAARLLSASNNYSQAIYHALEANTHDIAAELIVESAESMMNEGHAETLARWIDGFPAAMTLRHPRLLLIRANIYLKQANHADALPLLDAAEEVVQALIKQHDTFEGDCLPTFQAEITIARSHLLFWQGEYQQSLHLCQQLLTSLPADEVLLRAEIYMRVGMCHILQGNLTTGIAHLQKALHLWGRHAIRRQTADGHSALAAAYGLLGNFSLADHHFSRASACWEQLQDIWGKIGHMIRMGNSKLRQGLFAEAEQIFREALTLARGPVRSQNGEAYALSCLGQLYQRQEQYERALGMIEEALALARQLSDWALINSTLDDLAMNYLYMGDLETAQMLISEVPLQTALGDPIGYKLASHDLVHGTISLHRNQYDQAGIYLSKCEAILSKAGLKEEHLLALLRLAAVCIAQKKLSEAVYWLETAATIILTSEGYEQLAHQELRHLPALRQAMQAHAEFDSLCVQFSLKCEHQKEPRPTSLPAGQKVVSTPAVTSRQISILAFGEPMVSLGDEPITRWRMARAMELCFYLLDCGRPMRKEAIITALWPEIDDQTTRTFYSTIYYLRQALGGESVITAKNCSYALKLDALYGKNIWYDITAFEEYQAKARAASEEEEDEEARKAYLAMVELYRGDYVQPFYSDWCTIRRDNLRTAYLEARQQLALIAWRAEEVDECIVHWQQMLALDNWIEEAHYGLMRCYARQGKRGLALRQYQRCKDTLQQEFGTAPKASIQNLYQRLMGSL